MRRPTPDSLSNAAVFYLSRYAASEASLRRVLENKIRRAAAQDDGFAQDAQLHATLRQAIDKIVETHKCTGAINDAAFAQMKVHSLRRSGRSSRAISQKLSQKGIAASHIAQALEPEDGTDLRQADLKAAHAFAKKRSFGPYRKEKPEEAEDKSLLQKRRSKEMASMARAGFPFDLIQQVLGGTLDAYD